MKNGTHVIIMLSVWLGVFLYGASALSFIVNDKMIIGFTMLFGPFILFLINWICSELFGGEG